MKRQVEELKMFRIWLGVIGMDTIRNEYIKRKTQVKPGGRSRGVARGGMCHPSFAYDSIVY